ncbi:UMP phosphatase [Paracoccus haematequi]|uniref:UMP phosphatase n=1 Tax=Paracoccus haematequi TaxID=2491866 RepID=A0A3S4GQG5_9RHOB|nr:UMP phosphatase [Paracoccus haematequi]
MNPPDLAIEDRYASLSLDQAWTRYESIRDRLPPAARRGRMRTAARLLDVAQDYDGFLFDSFGVLNVGETVIPGAAECLRDLRARGKRFCILTNAASYGVDTALAKYRRMGLDVRADEVVSSRDVAFAHLSGRGWAAIAASGDGFEDAPAPLTDLLAITDWDTPDGFVFLSSIRWNAGLQDRLIASLHRRPRPVIIGNPDLVAPREGGLSLEPGFWGHDLQDRTGIVPRFFGKPYREAFDAGLARLSGRVAMVGDTLHTDILGGMDVGCDTILVTHYGILVGCEVGALIAQSGILPDLILPSI